MGFAKFMASSWGRLLRIVAGMALVYGGYFIIKGTGGNSLAIVGLVPLLAGLLDVCLLAPLFGVPLSGKAIRQA